MMSIITSTTIFALLCSAPILAKSRFYRQAEDILVEEGSGQLLFDETDPGSGSGSGIEIQHDDLIDLSSSFLQEINITNSDVETLLIKVHLPHRTPTHLIEQIRDETSNQTSLENKLNVAVSLTSVLTDLLETIQSAPADE